MEQIDGDKEPSPAPVYEKDEKEADEVIYTNLKPKAVEESIYAVPRKPTDYINFEEIESILRDSAAGDERVAKVMYDWKGLEQGQLSIAEGQILKVLGEKDDWFLGESAFKV